MTLVLHAYVSGADDARFAAASDVLRYARSHPGIEIRSAGALADDPEWDTIMAEIYQLRKLESRRKLYE